MGEQREALQSVGIERVVTVEPIGDINGDDLPELLWVQSTGPYAGTPYWFLSPSYTTYDSAWVPMAQPWDIWLLPRSST